MRLTNILTKAKPIINDRQKIIVLFKFILDKAVLNLKMDLPLGSIFGLFINKKAKSRKIRFRMIILSKLRIFNIPNNCKDRMISDIKRIKNAIIESTKELK